VINKIDLLGTGPANERRERMMESGLYRVAYLVSAATGHGVDAFLSGLFDLLPEGPAYYPEEDLTDLPMRFIAKEIIREKLFDALSEELPYSVAVAIEEYKEETEKGLVRIRAEIYVERESQKGILIGRGGRMLKKIGTAARLELEKETGERVYLDLFVKVEKDWSRSETILRRLGYA
jgi:GTP-binding protein Era